MHKTLFVLGTALVAAAAILGVPRFARPMAASSTPAPMETPREQLVRRDGQWWTHDGDHAFTGILVETYDNGFLKSRSAVTNGLLEGRSEGWYPDGQQQIVEHFRRGTSHGPRQKWYPNGRILSESTIADGRIEGVFQRWHENGVLAERMEMKAGVPDGLSVAFHPSGCRKSEARLRQGEVVEQRYWPDGEAPPPLDVAAKF
ncbi:MAG: toxin-antitoxin system YwqK family antitoxin [Verrucomicrobiales bacterium]|nr:toxin-antitoxin system YwqK family antitoxin [Verrucomicrobiales bacterium]